MHPGAQPVDLAGITLRTDEPIDREGATPEGVGLALVHSPPHDFEGLKAVSLARCRSLNVSRLPTFPPLGGLAASAGGAVVSEALPGAWSGARRASLDRMNA